MTENDQRLAVGIFVLISSRLMSAAFAMIVVLSVFVFLVGKGDVTDWFFVNLFASLGCFVFSAILGGAGMAAMAKSGADGHWSLEAAGGKFNAQALALLAGIVLLFLLFLSLRT